MTKQQKTQAGVANDINNGHTASMNNTRTENGSQMQPSSDVISYTNAFPEAACQIIWKTSFVFPYFRNSSY